MRTYGADSKPIQQYLSSWSVAKLVSPSLPVLKMETKNVLTPWFTFMIQVPYLQLQELIVRNTICAQKWFWHKGCAANQIACDNVNCNIYVCLIDSEKVLAKFNISNSLKFLEVYGMKTAHSHVIANLQWH